jgi:hypothetical protein
MVVVDAGTFTVTGSGPVYAGLAVVEGVIVVLGSTI